MDVNILSICITVFLGVVALALAVYFGLRNSTNYFGKKIDDIKQDIITELVGIKESITKISTRADDIFLVATVFAKGHRTGTIIVDLKHYGKTKVSAEPASSQTIYLVQPEKGKINDSTLSKVGKQTDLAPYEIQKFGRETSVMVIGNTLRIICPSSDPKVCTDYMSYFLKWLDTKYADAQQKEIEEFENDIKV